MTIGDYDIALDVLRSGEPSRLNELKAQLIDFPGGVDSFIGRRWILHALDVGPRSSVEWVLNEHVDLSFRDDEGQTPLLTIIDSRRADRHDLLELLLQAGAPVNRKGINDWTPAHMAAARDDVEALRILIAYGADLSIRTDIDDYATPLEEAKNLRRLKAVAFLEQHDVAT